MIPLWLSVVLMLAGLGAWMLTKKDYNLYDNWKEATLTVGITVALWLVWWQAGLEFFGWAAGEFNVTVFGLAWLVPSFLDHIIPKK